MHEHLWYEVNAAEAEADARPRRALEMIDGVVLTRSEGLSLPNLVSYACVTGLRAAADLGDRPNSCAGQRRFLTLDLPPEAGHRCYAATVDVAAGCDRGVAPTRRVPVDAQLAPVRSDPAGLPG